MHIFNLSSFFIKFLHIFVLPAVVSASIAGVELIEVVLSVTHFSAELTETMKTYIVLQIIPCLFYDI